MKKILGTLLSVLLVSSVLAGCSDSAGGSPADDSTPGALSSQDSGVGGDSIVLRYSWWGGDDRHEATLKNIEAYEALHPDIHIEPEYGAYSGYLDKLYVQLASRTVPDLVSIDGKWVPDMMRNYRDSFVNLRELPIDLSGFDPEFMSLICGDESFILGVSMGTNTYGVYYSPAFFEKFGLGDPTNWGWEDYIEAGIQVQQQDPESHLLYNILNNYGYIFKYRIKQKTGLDIVSDDLKLQFTKEDATEAWEYILQLVETGTVPSFEESMPYAANYPNEVPKWLEGKYGMHITQGSNLSAQVNGTPFEVKTANLPVLADAKDIGWPVSSSQVIGVYAYGEHIDEAAAFLDWYVNDESAMRTTGDTRGLPSNARAVALLEEEDSLMPQMVEFLERYEAQGNSAENTATVNSAILELTCEFAQQVAYKKMTPEEAAEAYMAELEIVVQSMV